MEQKQWTDLSNKVAIVTGGAVGIGEAMVEDLLACNVRVAIFDLAKPEGSPEDDRRVHVYPGIRNRKETETTADAAVQEFGMVDVLVNDAGVTKPRIPVDYCGSEPQHKLSEEDFSFTVGVNQKGTFPVSRAITRVLYGKKEGIIINLSPCAGLMGSRGHNCYSTTKAVIHASTISWAKGLGPYNIRVVDAAPDTLGCTPASDDEKYRTQAYGHGQDVNARPEKLFKSYKSSISLERPGRLYRVVDPICYPISDHASYITGVTIPVLGGKNKE